ncbi:UNKNOWN [Stylonychia lemnae]|uniref:Uncharacterized protein n=1 Tax=Stylonychia lemnae TaxID=5949 RepID=A0A078ATJ2_STYLE|nr:UNKNOWN [Stylonychia lemnae]|eukprot:CDW85554.1 UNKNOWN [Stylonychia lemnae]
MQDEDQYLYSMNDYQASTEDMNTPQQNTLTIFKKKLQDQNNEQRQSTAPSSLKSFDYLVEFFDYSAFLTIEINQNIELEQIQQFCKLLSYDMRNNQLCLIIKSYNPNFTKAIQEYQSEKWQNGLIFRSVEFFKGLNLSQCPIEQVLPFLQYSKEVKINSSKIKLKPLDQVVYEQSICERLVIDSCIVEEFKINYTQRFTQPFFKGLTDLIIKDTNFTKFSFFKCIDASSLLNLEFYDNGGQPPINILMRIKQICYGCTQLRKLKLYFECCQQEDNEKTQQSVNKRYDDQFFKLLTWIVNRIKNLPQFEIKLGGLTDIPLSKVVRLGLFIRNKSIDLYVNSMIIDTKINGFISFNETLVQKDYPIDSKELISNQVQQQQLKYVEFRNERWGQIVRLFAYEFTYQNIYF